MTWLKSKDLANIIVITITTTKQRLKLQYQL